MLMVPDIGCWLYVSVRGRNCVGRGDEERLLVEGPNTGLDLGRQSLWAFCS